MVREALKVLLLFSELLLELEETLLLTLADSPVLTGALTALEGVTVKKPIPSQSVNGLKTSVFIEGICCLSQRSSARGKSWVAEEESNSPRAACLGRRAGITLAHGSSSSGEGSSEGTECGRLGKGCAEHDGHNWDASVGGKVMVVVVFCGMTCGQYRGFEGARRMG